MVSDTTGQKHNPRVHSPILSARSGIAAPYVRDFRILHGNEFKVVFDRRLRQHGNLLSFHVMPNSLPYHRLGMAVSRKVSKKAVERNRIKRQLRDSFRHFQAMQLSDTGAFQGVDFVAVAKPAAGTSENSKLRIEIDGMWKRAASRAISR